MPREAVQIRLLSLGDYLCAILSILIAISVFFWVGHLFDQQAVEQAKPVKNPEQTKLFFAIAISAAPVLYITTIALVLIYTGRLIAKRKNIRRCIILSIVTSVLNPLLIILGGLSLLVLCDDKVEAAFADQDKQHTNQRIT